MVYRLPCAYSASLLPAAFGYEYGKDDSLRRPYGRYPEGLFVWVIEGGVEELGDHVDAAGFDFATCGDR
jgi:hypothetical protein